MTVLAIETATIDVAAALVDENGVLAQFALRGARRHVETLHPQIVELLAEAGVGLGELRAIAVDVGPGLFTGLRVGIAAAKGFALGLDIPAIGVCSTEILAAAALPCGTGLVVPVVDMRRGELAWTRPGAVELHLGPLEALVVDLEGLGDDLVLVGDGAERYAGELADALGRRVRLGGAALAAPPAPVLGALAVARFAAGEVTDAYGLAPVYLRDADARVNFATRPEPVPT